MKSVTDIIGTMTGEEPIRPELAVEWPRTWDLGGGGAFGKLAKPITQPDLKFVASTGQWVMSMDSKGILTLNPDVSQSEAVKEFVDLCNALRGIKG